MFRSYLLSDDTLRAERARFEHLVKTLNDLRQEDQPRLTAQSFEELMLPPFHNYCKGLFGHLKPDDADEILEKYVILSFLVSGNFLHHLHGGVDYFGHTIFADAIRHKYPTVEAVTARCMELRAKYQVYFNEIHNREIDRILSYPSQDTRPKFSSTLQLVHTDVTTRKTEPVYHHSVHTAKAIRRLMLEIIFRKIHSDLTESAKKKTVDFATLLKFRQFLEGNLTGDNTAVAKALFVKANNDLQFFKLPKEFNDQKNFILGSMFRAFLDAPRYYRDKKGPEVRVEDGERSQSIPQEAMKQLNMPPSAFHELKKMVNSEIDQRIQECGNTEFPVNIPGVDTFKGTDEEREFAERNGELVNVMKLQVDEFGRLASPAQRDEMREILADARRNRDSLLPDELSSLPDLPVDQQFEELDKFFKKGVK